ncbi:MAG: hypothetical protein DWI22_13765 [Planctomycetota bacterium]|nr:MAG: hypothetical protein DWI22_13765 [Planctomycetota bacterium]
MAEYGIVDPQEDRVTVLVRQAQQLRRTWGARFATKRPVCCNLDFASKFARC